MWNQYTANIILDYSYRHIKANLSEIGQNKIQTGREINILSHNLFNREGLLKIILVLLSWINGLNRVCFRL